MTEHVLHFSAKTPDAKKLKKRIKGPRRQWELWSPRETNVFFEAVYEVIVHVSKIEGSHVC